MFRFKIEQMFFIIKQTDVLLRGGKMKEQLIKAMQHNQLIDLMYISQDGKITKRRIKLIKIIGDKFQAFCFTKHAKRTFIINNALAILPVIQKERREVI